MEDIIKDIERSTGMPSYWKGIVLDLIQRLQTEIKRLKENNANQVRMRCDMQRKFDDLQNLCIEQKAEIERLTEWKDKLQDTKDELEQQLIDTGFKEYCEENKRLTEENAELQKQVEELLEESVTINKNYLQECEEHLKTVQIVKELQKQVDELKEKIMNLKSTMIDRVACKSYDSLLTTPDDVEEIFADAYESEFNKFLEQSVKDTAKEIYQELCGHGTTYVKKWIKEHYGVEVE